MVETITNRQLKILILYLGSTLGKNLRHTSLWRELKRDPVVRLRILRRLREIEQILQEVNNGPNPR